MSTCIYCGKDGKVTKEHILPSFIYEYQRSISHDKAVGWQEKAKKITGGEATIKDTCSDCNNVTLSQLDGYAKNLLKCSGFFTECFLKEQVKINYNYNLLSRWLLKVAFNSSRASGKQLTFFEKYTDIILGENTKLSGFVIFAGLLKPVKLTHQEIEKYSYFLKNSSSGYVNPFFGRISHLELGISEFAVKQIVIGAAIFHIISFKDNLIRERQRVLIKEYLRVFQGMTLIRNNKSKIKVIQTPITFIDSLEDQMQRPEVKPYLMKLSKDLLIN